MSKSMDYLVERIGALEDQLAAKTVELERRQDAQAYQDEWRWRDIRTLRERESGSRSSQLVEDTNFDLPVPRLELRVRRTTYSTITDYGLVKEHLCGQIEFIPISSTRSSGGVAWWEEPGGPEERIPVSAQVREKAKLNAPYRDGAHIAWDADKLDLPAYVVNVTARVYRKLRFTKRDTPHGPQQIEDINWPASDIFRF